DARMDPVTVSPPELCAPEPAARVELAGSVSLHVPGELLKLDPQEPGAVGRAAGIHGQRLADDNGRLGRQQTALRFVDGARDAVEPRRQVNQRRPAEAFVALPARRLGQREVDLHLGAPVTECRWLA